MNKKQLLILIVLAVVLGGLGWWAYQKQLTPYEESTRRMGDKLIPDFPLNDVAEVVIRQASNTLHLVKKEDVWTVAERNHYPANFSTLSDFIRKVWELKITSPITTSESRLPQLELVPPEKGPSTLVEFKDKDGKVLHTLLLGAKHMRESSSSSPFGGGSWPDGRYVMVDNDVKTVALVAEPFTNIEPNPQSWLDKDWFKVEKHKAIAVKGTNASDSWKIFRESETGSWKLADTKPDEEFDTTKISSITSVFSYPSFNDVVTNAEPKETGLDNPRVATIETFDGFTYTVKIGNKTSDDNYYVQVDVTADLPKERTPGKDEKPEDKEKLDKEFKEKIEKLQEKLKKEQRAKGWVYRVSKWTVDPLLKTRKDLIKEKKAEEKKPEPKPATTSSTKPTPPPEPTPLVKEGETQPAAKPKPKAAATAKSPVEELLPPLPPPPPTKPVASKPVKAAGAAAKEAVEKTVSEAAKAASTAATNAAQKAGAAAQQATKATNNVAKPTPAQPAKSKPTPKPEKKPAAKPATDSSKGTNAAPATPASASTNK